MTVVVQDSPDSEPVRRESRALGGAIYLIVVDSVPGHGGHAFRAVTFPKR